MQIVFYVHNLNEISKSVFWKKKKGINLLSAELAQRVVKVDLASHFFLMNQN